MKRLIIIAGLVLVYLSTVSFAFGECVLKMTYKDGDKMPLIAKKPDNSGAYFDLFDKAAKKIGCRLSVVRLPKKRLHHKLSKGTLDFYPGASFSKKRAKYLYYIENGFDSGEYGITPLNVPDITSFQQIKEVGLIWLMEHGSSKRELAKEFKIKTQDVRHADIDRARELFRAKRSNFYVADKELIDYYPKKSGISSLTDAGLKVHKQCCGGDTPMYLGFSRFSPHFKEKANPDYDKSKPMSRSNFPTVVVPGSIAHKLGQALLEMKKAGTSAAIWKKNFAN